MMTTLSKLKIHNSVYFLILLALLSGSIKPVLLIMCIIIIHEVGHVFFSYLFHIEVTSIEIYPFGGLTTLNKHIHERIYKDLLISLGGIFFELLLHLIFIFLYHTNLIIKSTYLLFNTYNKSIIIFNLLPIIPLDGSKFLHALLTKLLPYKSSYILTIIISTISLIIFIIYNAIYKLNDIIIYLFLFIKLIELIKNYKYIINKFYLERIMYNHYYNQIIYQPPNLNHLRLDKYYFFKEHNHYLNEKEYLRKYYFS